MSIWGKSPAGSAALELGAITTVLVAGAQEAHIRGLEAVQAAESERVMGEWHAALAHSRASAADAIALARSAVSRAQAAEAEVAALRKAVASRDALIRRLSS